jgi:UDP-N-acetylmuramoyl-L-alanyl-D-glutamate--2,6-diaminopimelate ligase
MTLGALLLAVSPPASAPALAADAARPCTGVTHDSRAVRPGMVFVACQGRKADGASFVAQAIAAGAAAIVSAQPPLEAVTVPWIVVEEPRLALALLADEFYGHPSQEMPVVGVTGTNGKTTTSFIAHSIFEAAGITCGLMGTVGYRVGEKVIEATRTTPEAPELQSLLRQMRDEGCGACVMEVSSHALALRPPPP